MNRFYEEVAKRAMYKCEYCGASEEAFNFAFEVEHITPKARGGSNSLPNLALACIACNSYKGVFETGYDAETQTEVTLFHPRRDTWAEHFQFRFDSGEIIGLTLIGRATVHRLQLNSQRQVFVRLLWVQSDLYP